MQISTAYMAKTNLSVIVPLYNEEESARPLFDALTGVLESCGRSFEILFVDDGSRDRTFQVCAEIARSDRRLRIVKLRRNYGQTPAMVAGIDHANGETLITMDGDLQNDPMDIPNFLAEIDCGYDIVVGWRRKRQDKLITRVIPSKIANWLISGVTGVSIKDNGCSLKAYRSDLIKNIPLYSEMHRFIPAMTSLAGAKVKQIEVRHHPRMFGESKYGLTRIYKVAFDLIAIKTLLSFANNAVGWFMGAALIAVLLSGFVLGYAVWQGVHAPAEITAVELALAAMVGATATYLLLLGVLCNLIRHASGHVGTTFSRLTETRLGRGAERPIETVS
jgi:glycosyltransferase involved in cell wall biosynthesis